MSKRGRQYQRVTAAVLQVFDPRAAVTESKWVIGPDGRRELDVLVTGTVDGRPTKVIVECKDFNPKTTGPVGIGYVDALESKRRDLGTQFALICSNAGFTADALRKANRVGIGLVSVMCKGDNRVRFAVIEEVYTRKIQIKNLSFTLESAAGSVDSSGGAFEDVLYNGSPVANWVARRVMLFLGTNAIVNGPYKITHRFTSPVRFEWKTGSSEVTQIMLRVTIQGGWFAHRVEIDTTAGFYDWLRRRVRMAPGAGQLEIKGIDVHNGDPIDVPPSYVLKPDRYLPGEIGLTLMLVDGLPEPKTPAPELDAFIAPEDLDLALPDLPSEAYTSAP